AEDGIRDGHVTGVQTCALPISDTTPISSGVYTLAVVRGLVRRVPADHISVSGLTILESFTHGVCNGIPHFWLGQQRHLLGQHVRSEERRVGKGCISRVMGNR